MPCSRPWRSRPRIPCSASSPSAPICSRPRCAAAASAWPWACPGEDQALAWLQPRVKGGDPRLLLRLAHGAPLRALTLGDPALLARREAAFAGFLAVGQGTRDPVAEAQAWSDLSPRVSLEWLGGWLSDLLRLHADRGWRTWVIPTSARPWPRWRVASVAACIAAGHRYLQRVLRARATQDNPLNPQLLHESLLIDWAHLARKVS